MRKPSLKDKILDANLLYVDYTMTMQNALSKNNCSEIYLKVMKEKQLESGE